MPELPEVETVRTGITPYIQGQSFTRVVVNRHDLRAPIPLDFAQMVTGMKIMGTQRRGKYIFIHLQNGQSIVLHLGMSGRVRVFHSVQDYEAQKHDHVIFHCQEGACISFNDARRFGMLYTLPSDQIDQTRPFSEMGPEPLSDQFTAKYLFEALKNKKAPIKNILLDQAIVAGLGNIYVCEILFRAAIMPTRIGTQINQQEAERIHTNTIIVLNEAIAAGGSTLKDHRMADGQLGYFQHRFKVYGRENESCSNACGHSVERCVQAGRSTFYCSICQL